MTGEQFDGEEHEGEKYLRLLGLEHLADREVTAGGRTFQARDFLEICGEHALPMLIGFEAMSPDNPGRETVKNTLRGFIGQYVGEEALTE